MSARERVREVRERLFADRAVVANADGGRRELFPVAIGIAEGLALLEWLRKEHAQHTPETRLGFGNEWRVLRTGPREAFPRPFDQFVDFA